MFETYGHGGQAANIATVPATCPTLATCTARIRYLTSNPADGLTYRLTPRGRPYGSRIRSRNGPFPSPGEPDTGDWYSDVFTMDPRGHLRRLVSQTDNWNFRPNWGVSLRRTAEGYGVVDAAVRRHPQPHARRAAARLRQRAPADGHVQLPRRPHADGRRPRRLASSPPTSAPRRRDRIRALIWPARPAGITWPADPALLQAAELTLGRAPDCALVFADDTVSRHHARLELRDGRWFLVDLDSSNGTLVNGRRVRDSEVRAGDEIRLGAAGFTPERLRHADREQADVVDVRRVVQRADDRGGERRRGLLAVERHRWSSRSMPSVSDSERRSTRPSV